MALETKLLQKLNQSLLMTPQLQQAIKLLQLGRLEYKEAIENELLENPVLEEFREDDGAAQQAPSEQSPDPLLSAADNAPASSDDVDAKGDWENYLETFTDYSGTATPKGTVDYEERPPLENSVTRTETLQEHLFSQIRFLDLSEPEEKVILHIVGNLNRDGYLCSDFDELARECEVDVDVVEKLMDVMRSLEPVGIGARNLQECLAIQLENMGYGNGLPHRLITTHLDRLEARKYEQIAKLEGVTIEQVFEALGVVRKLDPRPGRLFAEDETRYITPDVFVYKVGSEYVVSLNEDGLPKLRVSPYYLDLLKSGEVASKSYLNERLKAASWLIKSIHQRQQTIFRVTESIMKFQREFLDHGISRLKPLVLKDVADDIGMHESTVSRVTTDKYVHTPRGVFELKFFFTTGIRTAQGEVSSSSIKEKIRNIIAKESPQHPVSDQEIVDLLKKEEVEIARRTVAKYREGLGIPSSSRRKRPF
jgi:RNA polymerase sigma-54 factor